VAVIYPVEKFNPGENSNKDRGGSAVKKGICDFGRGDGIGFFSCEIPGVERRGKNETPSPWIKRNLKRRREPSWKLLTLGILCVYPVPSL
jgi:hypothetical protein